MRCVVRILDAPAKPPARDHARTAARVLRRATVIVQCQATWRGCEAGRLRTTLWRFVDLLSRSRPCEGFGSVCSEGRPDLEISSQAQLRRHGQPEFCYLCGQPLLGVVDRDHCPPKGLFAPGDRIDFPVILPTHRTCNHGWHGVDELTGILTDALHSRKKSQNESVTKRLEAYSMPFNGKTAAAVANVPLDLVGKRVMRAIHALLYKSYLPEQTRNQIHVPLPSADMRTGERHRPLDQSYVFSGEVTKALLARSADTVTAYNGAFRYACVWNRLENGSALCMFAFDIYAFHVLAPPVVNFPKCFVGMYLLDEAPLAASWAPKVAFDLPRHKLLDPWQRP